MGSLHDSLKLFLATNLMFSSYLFIFDWCLVCFQKFVSSFIHFPIGRCYLKEGCEDDVASSCNDRLTASCSNPATSNNHTGSNDEAMGAWHNFKKSGQQMTTGFTVSHSQNSMMWEIMRWSSELQWNLPTHHYINFVVGNGMCGTCRPCADRIGAQSKSEQCFYLRLLVSCMKTMGVHELQSMMPEASREQV